MSKAVNVDSPPTNPEFSSSNCGAEEGAQGLRPYLTGGGGDEYHLLLRRQLDGIIRVRAHHPNCVVPPGRLAP